MAPKSAPCRDSHAHGSLVNSWAFKRTRHSMIDTNFGEVVVMEALPEHNVADVVMISAPPPYGFTSLSGAMWPPVFHSLQLVTHA